MNLIKKNIRSLLNVVLHQLNNGFSWYIVYKGWNTMHYISLKYHFCTIHILPYIRLIQCIFVYIGGNPWPRISVYNSRREFYISIWLLGSSWTLKLSVNLSVVILCRLASNLLSTLRCICKVPIKGIKRLNANEKPNSSDVKSKYSKNQV